MSHKKRGNAVDWTMILKDIFFRLQEIVKILYYFCMRHVMSLMDSCTSTYAERVMHKKPRRSDKIRFAMFDVKYDSDDRLRMTMCPWSVVGRRYCDGWIELLDNYNFPNTAIGLGCLTCYPAVSLYLLTCTPILFWTPISYQISWSFWTLGLSLASMIVTIPLSLLAITTCIMCIMSSWIPIIGAMLGISGLGYMETNSNSSCPFYSGKFGIGGMSSYFCLMTNTNKCPFMPDKSEDESECSELPTTTVAPTEPTTTEKPPTTLSPSTSIPKTTEACTTVPSTEYKQMRSLKQPVRLNNPVFGR